MQLLYGVSAYGTTTSCRNTVCAVVIVVVTLAAGIQANEDSPATFFPLQTNWMTELGQPPAAAPAYDDEQVFVALRDGTLVALKIGDGSIAWTSEVATEFTPVVADELVIVAIDQRLVGLRAVDAVPLWTTELGAPISVQPLLTTGWLVVGLESGEIVVLRASDGTEFWRDQLSGLLEVQPAVGGSTLFVPVADGRIVALELVTGHRLWEYRLRGSPRQILPLDALFVGSTDNFMYRLSRKNGKMEWMWRTGADIVGLPAVDEHRVFFVSLDNVLRALDRDSGVQQWKRALPGRPTAGPQIVGTLALVSGVAPQLRAFDTETGAPAGVLEAQGELAVAPDIIRPPSPLAPGLIVTTGDGRLSVMGSPTGPPQFSLSFPPEPLLPTPERLLPADVLPFSPLVPPPLLRPPADVLSLTPLHDVETEVTDESTDGQR
jgi:outer membrane protein assembly factor BamB